MLLSIETAALLLSGYEKGITPMEHLLSYRLNMKREILNIETLALILFSVKRDVLNMETVANWNRIVARVV